jgi:sulfonate transport system substrate-binding protein
MATGKGRSRSILIVLLVIAVAGIAAAALFLVRPGGGSGADEDAARILTVGDQRGGAQALLLAAGELEDVPYRIKWALFPAASPLLEALDAGAIDVGGIGGAPFAFAYASGAKIRAVTAYRPLGSATGKASAIVVPRGSPLRGVADLKGKRLATIRGSAGQDLALRLLERAGVDPRSIRWVYLSNGEAKAALETGAIDAWSTWGSYVGIAVLEDGNRVLADGQGLPAGAGFFAASDSAIEAKRAILHDFLERLARARSWGRAHPDRYAEILARETRIPLDVARFSIEASVGSSVPIDDALIAQQRQIFARYHAAGIIPTQPDLAGAYDPSFNDAVSGATTRTANAGN